MIQEIISPEGENYLKESQKLLICNSPQELPFIAREIIDFASEDKIWIFEGEMGAGKTTLIRAICKQMQVIDNVASPTFSIVNEYSTSDNKIIYHFDFYRIGSESEAMDLGYEEYLYSGNYCFIEWPSKINSLLPHSVIKIEIEVTELEQRTIRISCIH